MFARTIFTGALLLCPFLANAQSLPSSQQELAARIEALLLDEAYENAWWSVTAIDLHSGDLLYSRNGKKSFIPASNTKLYTTAAALDQLRPDFRYQTHLYIDGPVLDGVLQGNLIVQGSGDPVIGGRFNDGDLTEVFRAWADSIRSLGITSIQGDIIGDDDVFDEIALGYGWSWDDEPFWYAAEISGLSFNDNCVDFSIESQEPGMPGRITWEPHQTTFVSVSNSTLSISADSSLDEGYSRPREGNDFRLFSQVPSGKTDNESLSVSNPTLFFTHVLRETLLEQGIAVSGQHVDIDALPIKPAYGSASLSRIATHYSPPLDSIVSVINKQSQNLYAEQVLKTLGVHRPVDDLNLISGSAAMGIEAAMATFVQAGIDTSRIQLVDGSGLSRMNLVTTEMTTDLLRYMWKHNDPVTRDAFVTSLAVSGEEGSLKHRFVGTPFEGKVRAKTGTVSNASTLSGYLVIDPNTAIAFSIMCNHYILKTSKVREVQDAIVTYLAETYAPEKDG